jgi:hypothetical protein
MPPKPKAKEPATRSAKKRAAQGEWEKDDDDFEPTQQPILQPENQPQPKKQKQKRGNKK